MTVSQELLKSVEISTPTAEKFQFDEAIVQALKTIRVPKYMEREWLHARLRDIQTQIRILEAELVDSENLPVYNVSRTVGVPLQELRLLEKHFWMAIVGYPGLLYPEFLSWPQESTEWPLFMVLSLNSPQVTISVSGDSRNFRRVYAPSVPKFIMNQYEATFQKLALGLDSYSDKTIFIQAEFEGKPPKETKARLKKARESGLFTEFYLIAEAPSAWVEGIAVNADRDPIIVGLEKDTHQLFVIDAYNPTKFEAEILKNFVLPPR